MLSLDLLEGNWWSSMWNLGIYARGILIGISHYVILLPFTDEITWLFEKDHYVLFNSHICKQLTSSILYIQSYDVTINMIST